MFHAFFTSSHGSTMCGWIGHQATIKLPYTHMPNKTYFGCERCGTNLEDSIYGNDASANANKMRNRRILFEIIFWAFWIVVFAYLTYLAVEWA